MSRSRNRAQTAPAIPQDDLAWRVVDFFKGHPDEVLTARDVAKKFDIAPSAVDSMLFAAVVAGHLARQKSDEYGVIYRLPAKRTAIAAPFTPALDAAMKRTRAARRQAARVDFAAIVIEKGVPLVEPRKRIAHWNALFDRMEPGDSFQLANSLRDAVMHARQHYRVKIDPTKTFVIRKMDEQHTRVWRTA